MKTLILIVSALFISNAVYSQTLINVPSDNAEGTSVGSISFDGIDFTTNAISNDSVHGTLLSGSNANSYLTCVTTESRRVNINYVTAQVKIGNKLILGNFGFDSYDNCKLVAMKIAANPGKMVNFKVVLDGLGQKTGKIISIEWKD